MTLDELRKKIDSIDAQIVGLLNERYHSVIEVGKLKKNTAGAIYVPEREKLVFEKVCALNHGPMTENTLKAVYREIMSGALSLEHPLNIAYLGPEGTFTHLAAVSKFGHSVAYVPKGNIEDIFADVYNGRADYGCLPVENSTEGAVSHTLDLFVKSEVKICAEINMRVHQCLLSKCPVKSIKKIYSHAQSLSQCRGWISEYLPDVELHECSSNSRAAAMAVEEPNSGAIASAFAGEIYGLDLLASNIEDNPNNTTRFLVLGNQMPKPTGDDKTSICFAIKDRVGVLYDALLPFKKEGITLTMIESRPSKLQNWEYYFFIDLLGHIEDEKVKSAIEALRPMTQALRVLGSYPRGAEAQ